MNRIEILKVTVEVFKNVFGEHSKIDEQTSSDDLHNWDSLNHIILIQKLEKRFDLKFDLFEIIELRDVKGIVAYIHTKMSNEA